MKRELADYRVNPRVVLAGKESHVSIIPRGAHARFTEGQEYEIRFVPMERSLDAVKDKEYETVKVTSKSGELEFTYNFSEEQMYQVRVIKNSSVLWNFTMYALNEDLYGRRPLKGDFHVHSYYSDGKEEPAVVAANYRKNGFDFLALTDHERWFPSDEAIEKYKNVPTDLKLFHGEEVHSFGGYIHAINFGGSYSVNELFKADEDKCYKEAAELAKGLKLENNADPVDYGKRLWIAREIKKSGGLAIYVHPHWMNNAFNIQDSMSDEIFKNEVYDAFELLGGQTVFENNMQLGLYMSQIAKGRKIGVVGASDSHGTEPAMYFTEEYTVVFANGTELEDIKDAVKSGYSAAVEKYPEQEHRAWGNYRMMKYTLFLLNEYFPEYCELCFEQGRAMKELMTGTEDTLPLLKLLKGRTDRYYNEFFGR